MAVTKAPTLAQSGAGFPHNSSLRKSCQHLGQTGIRSLSSGLIAHDEMKLFQAPGALYNQNYLLRIPTIAQHSLDQIYESHQASLSINTQGLLSISCAKTTIEAMRNLNDNYFVCGISVPLCWFEQTKALINEWLLEDLSSTSTPVCVKRIAAFHWPLESHPSLSYLIANPQPRKFSLQR